LNKQIFTKYNSTSRYKPHIIYTNIIIAVSRLTRRILLNCTMPKPFIGILFLVFTISCKEATKNNLQATSAIPIQGTWKLLKGTLIEKGDTTITDYTKDLSFIKIINDSHFSFLQHDTRKDSTNFSAGGGRYTLTGNTYTEHLEYCSAKEWEGHDFTFTVTITNDTLIQTGVEKIEAQGIDRLNTEKYIRYKE